MAKFEVSLEERLAQQKAAREGRQRPALGYHRYRVYPIREKIDVPPKPKARLDPFSSVSTIIISKNRKVDYSRQLSYYLYGRNVGKTIFDTDYYRDYMKGEVKWLKPKHATALRIKGHKVEELE